ncbi:MAG: ATP-binding cassette domain-containing protein [Acidobacteria bacterium]|nr:ATP-binding cassette domain-containing protein [Acidobacteriota bacterium]
MSEQALIARETEKVPGERDDSLLIVRDLRKYFPLKRGVLSRTVGQVKAVDGVSFAISPGQTLGLVGESGSGKTTIGRSILRLIEPTSGSVVFDGTEITELDAGDMRRKRQDMQVVFQDPYASLNPRMRVGTIVGEPLEIHTSLSRSERKTKVEELLEKVGLEGGYAQRYPHEFSGGQRQRIGVARALATNPKFLVLDEPVSALDVSIQAQILNLLKDLQDELGLTMLFISHDLPVIRQMCDRIAVMRNGRIQAIAATEVLFEHPQHAYTKHLLELMPSIGSAPVAAEATS